MSADFDKAIDGAVREMLDVEPPADLRARVLGEIDGSSSVVASTFRWKALWFGLPLAAAAVLILALMLPSTAPRQPETTTAAVDAPRAPVTTPPATMTPPVSVEAPRPVVEPRSVAANREPEPRRIVTATALTMPDDGATGIAPLKSISAIDVPPIPGNPIAPADIAVRPLNPIAEVQIAPLTPPERRN